MFQFKKDRLKTKEKLGKGRFGSVFPYQKSPEDLKWVVKRIKAEDPDALVAFLPEVILGMSCDHSNIIPIKSYFIEKILGDEGYNIYTKLPRMKGTLLDNLKDRKEKNSPYSEEEIIRHFYSLVCGVEYLHNKKIFHGDLKPESLLLDHNRVLKIGDIGITKHTEEKYPMSFQYSAPEVLGADIKKEMIRKADIWSLGVVILELCCLDIKLLNASMPKDQLQERLNELFARLQGKYPGIIVSLLVRILSLDPEQRPDIGLIRGELENSYPEILGLKNDKKKNNENQNNLAISDEQKQEIFGKYEVEIQHLKAVIAQFESELTRKTYEFEEEKARIIKDCDNSLAHELEKRMKLHERFKDLEAQVDKEAVIPAERESYGKDYRINLQKVVSQLNEKWNKWYKLVTFECEVNDDVLRITSSIKYPIKDSDLIMFLKDLLPTLEENSLLNLYGIIFLIVMTDVTDKSMAEFASILCHEPLKLEYLQLEFLGCKKLTDQSFEELSKVIAIRAHSLTYINLRFDDCTGLTDKSLGYLATSLSNPSLKLESLGLTFKSVKGMTDSGFENLTKAIEQRNRSCQSMSKLELLFSKSKVTAEKKMQAKKLFETFAYVNIQ